MIEILVVEDSVTHQKTIKDELVSKGYSVEIAGCLEAAIEYIDMKNWAALVVDMKLPTEEMPKGDLHAGVKVIDYCRKKRPFTKCVVLTQKESLTHETEKLIKCLEADAFRWVYKGEDGYLERLSSKVREAVDFYKQDNGGIQYIREHYMNRLGCSIHTSDNRCTPDIINEIKDKYSDKNVFLAIPYKDYDDRKKAIEDIVEMAGLNSIIAKNEPDHNVKVCNFCCAIKKCKYVIADVSKVDCVNVMYEVGLSHALSKRVALLFNKDDDEKGLITEMPWDISVFIPIEYGPNDGKTISRLRQGLADWFIRNAKNDVNIENLTTIIPTH
ncbi:response regulator [bacterium]|nr:response regulator [bacterium]